MVMMLLTSLLLALPARADVIQMGLSLPQVAVSGSHASVQLSFSSVGAVGVTDSKIQDLIGYRLSTNSLRVTNSAIAKINLSAARLPNTRWSSVTSDAGLFIEVDLRGGVFDQVSFSNCSFDRADLRGARFINTTFFNCSFTDAKFDNQTVLPFDPHADVEKGMIYVP